MGTGGPHFLVAMFLSHHQNGGQFAGVKPVSGTGSRQKTKEQSGVTLAGLQEVGPHVKHWLSNGSPGTSMDTRWGLLCCVP